MKRKLFEVVGGNQFRLATTSENATSIPDTKMFQFFSEAKTEMGYINEIFVEVDRIGQSPDDSMINQIEHHSQAVIQHLGLLLQYLQQKSEGR